MDEKFKQFANTIWCAPKHYDTVCKHKQAFTTFFRESVDNPEVKDDSYMPENMVLVVTKDLQLKIINLK